MKAVFKKEFFSLFHRFYGYIAVTLLALFMGIFLILNNLTYSTENILSLLSSMSVVSALIIPVVGISVYPNRKRTDTDAIYDIMPISVRDIVLGKYSAALAVIMLPNILLVLCPVIAGIFGEMDHMTSYSAILGFLFFEASLLAICAFIAKICRSRLWAYIFSYVIIVVWYFSTIASVLIPPTALASLIAFCIFFALAAVVLGFVTKKIVLPIIAGIAMCGASVLVYILNSQCFPGLFENFWDKISIFEQFNNFTYGIFHLEGIIFFSIVTTVFIFLTWRLYSKKYITKSSSTTLKRATSMAMAVLMVASSFAISIAAAIVPDRFLSYDATIARKSSISDEAKDFLNSVEKDVTVYLLEPMGYSDYELYLEKLTAENPHIKLEKIYNANNPEFYTDRDISLDSISANSLVIECGERIYYVSYYNLFYYTNKNLSSEQMTYSDYQYLYSMFIQSEQYAEYLESLIYDTTMYFNGDSVICSYIEFATADIIPTNYSLTGHGEKDIMSTSNPFYGLSIAELDISESDIPADATSIFINMPTSDITETEKQKLLDYLENGGQITFVTSEKNLEMPNICSVLAAYGMTASTGAVNDTITDEDENQTVTNEFVPTVHTSDNDILYYLDELGENSKFAPLIKDANAITVNESVRDNLISYPLLSSSDTSFIGDNDDTKASYILACAVEVPSKGSKLVWFTGGESFNKADSDAAMTVMYALSWVTLVYETEVDNIPPVLYQMPRKPIAFSSSGFVCILLAVLPMCICVAGIIIIYKRKKAQ